MRREGSPWTGLWAVFFKEMADHLTGLRMRILEVLILLSALGALYTGSQALRQTVGRTPSSTSSSSPRPRTPCPPSWASSPSSSPWPPSPWPLTR